MTVTTYVWDVVNDSYLAEYTSVMPLPVVYTNTPGTRGGLVSQYRSDATLYHAFDGSGSTRQLVDDFGDTVASYDYDAFGNIAGGSGAIANPFTYRGAKGAYWDPERSLYYMRARSYSPLDARFMSVDPLELAFQLDGTMDQAYSYARNDPILFGDPTGLKCEDETSWKQSLCKCKPPCKCEDTKVGKKEVTDDQLEKLKGEFTAAYNKKPALKVSTPVKLVKKGVCIQDYPYAALTCQVPATGKPTSVVMCIPKVSYCMARGLMAHEMAHAAWIANDKYNETFGAHRRRELDRGAENIDADALAATVRVHAEKEAYEEQCDEMLRQRCDKRKTPNPNDVSKCVLDAINFSVGNKPDKGESKEESLKRVANFVNTECAKLVSDANV